MGLLRRSLFQGDRHVEAWLAPHHSRDVSASGSIVCQHDVARSEAADSAVAGLDLALAGEGDHVLTPGRGVPILGVAGCGLTKDNTFTTLKLPDLDLYLLKVGFAVGSRIESSDLHNGGL